MVCGQPVCFNLSLWVDSIVEQVNSAIGQNQALHLFIIASFDFCELVVFCSVDTLSKFPYLSSLAELHKSQSLMIFAMSERMASVNMVSNNISGLST